MDLPVPLSVKPMLARLTRELPLGDGWVYEPKWDGFRCLAFRDAEEVDLRSRNGRPFARYFPEVVSSVRALREQRVVLDGELIVAAAGRMDFNALLSRLHPAASRVARLATETPATYVAFDVLAVGDRDLRQEPLGTRRSELERILADSPAGLVLTPLTRDPDVAAEWLEHRPGRGLDGVVAKRVDAPYEPGQRAMRKVKRERTMDCVVGGVRLFADPPAVASLLLGLHDRAGNLRHIGVAASFPESQRQAWAAALPRLATPLDGHPWAEGFGADAGPVGRLGGAATRWTPDLPLDWLPLRPVLVCEVAFDHLDQGTLRYPARFLRWRTDRDARSCTFDQLDEDDAAVVPP